MDKDDVIKLEEEHGTEILLKIGLSALNRLLVAKGVITEEELTQEFYKEAEYFTE